MVHANGPLATTLVEPGLRGRYAALAQEVYAATRSSRVVEAFFSTSG